MGFFVTTLLLALNPKLVTTILIEKEQNSLYKWDFLANKENTTVQYMGEGQVYEG